VDLPAHALHTALAMIRHQAASTVFTATFAFFSTVTAFAQQAPAPPKPREGKAEFALVTTSGNAASQSIGLAAEVTLRPPQWVIEAKTAFVRNEAEDVLNAKSFVARGRVARVLAHRLQVFGQHAYLRDLFAGIEHRNFTDGGLSLLVLETARQTLYADFGGGYLNEQRTEAEALSTATAGPGARYKLKLSETSDITEDMLFSFDLSAAGTWRFANAVALTAKVATPLSLKLSNIVRYVDEPVAGFEKTDTITSAALVLSF
jgi:putative salt-induced outer membrane protein YdiY